METHGSQPAQTLANDIQWIKEALQANEEAHREIRRQLERIERELKE
jgi:hypothetical protein